MLRVKNMHFGSPSDSWDQCGKAKPGYVQYIIMQGEAELRILELNSVFHHFPSIGPKHLCSLAHLVFTCKAGKYFLVTFNSQGEIKLKQHFTSNFK